MRLRRPVRHPSRVFLAALLVLLGLLRYAALWDHATRLRHPFATSLEELFPDVVAVTGWLKEQPVTEVGVPSRHRDPFLFHRVCEMAYPVRCRPFPRFPPLPGDLVVTRAEGLLAEGLLAEEELPASVPVMQHGAIEVRRISGPRSGR